MILRAKQKLGKYRIEGRLGEGGFAVVYRAQDTVEGIRVALKVPFQRYMHDEALQDFRHEVRVAARLDHPNILPIKNADIVDGQFVIAYPLGERTLADRLQNRMSLDRILDFAEQMIAGVAYAHSHRIIHCDVKPENVILFDDNRLRLTDFGIAKVAMQTIRGSGSGSVGYIAPEQAMGQASFRSDVFSLGLILYRMLAGYLPEWPYEWPPPGVQKLRRRTHPDLIKVIRRALEVNFRKRYRDAGQMLTAFQRVKGKALRFGRRSRGRSNTTRKRRRTARR